MSWTIKEWSALAGLIGALVLGVIWIWKKVVKPIATFVKQIGKVEDVSKDIQLLFDRHEYTAEKINVVIRLIQKPMFVCNEEGVCMLANEALCELFGAVEGQMTGTGWLNFLHNGDRDKTYRAVTSAIKEGQSDLKARCRVINGITNEEFMAVYHLIINRVSDNIIAIGNITKL